MLLIRMSAFGVKIDLETKYFGVRKVCLEPVRAGILQKGAGEKIC